MKNLVLCLAALFILSGCKRNEVPIKKSSVLFLKVDYLTHQFEGAAEQTLDTPLPAVDTLPIGIRYRPPGDFGWVELFYKPDDKLLFKGTIIWMGKGAISHPVSFNAANTYPSSAMGLPYPGNARFKTTASSNTGLDQEIWKAVSKLRIVSEYYKANKKIGIFLYQPSVGIGNPADWDWFLIMGK